MTVIVQDDHGNLAYRSFQVCSMICSPCFKIFFESKHHPSLFIAGACRRILLVDLKQLRKTLRKTNPRLIVQKNLNTVTRLILKLRKKSSKKTALKKLNSHTR